MPKVRSPPAMLETPFENTLAPRRNTVRKSSSAPDDDDDDVIPIAIQLFFWRQSSPFYKQKFGKLTDASSIIFDRVLVQNILHGLSPSLTDAIASIPRWLLMKAAFPHVMYVCSCTVEHTLQTGQRQSSSAIRSSLLMATTNTRPRGSVQLQIPSGHPISMDNPILLPRVSFSVANQGLNAIDIRLFHTLHHLILSSTTQLLPLSTIQLFIYLFMPHIDTYLRNNEKDFLSNINLAQGMKLIWHPLFQHQQPNVPIFNSFVKPLISVCQPQKPSSPVDITDRCPRASTASGSIDSKSVLEKPVLANTTSQTLTRTAVVESQQPTKTTERADSIVTPTTTFDSIADLSSYKLMESNRQRQAPIVHMSSIYSVSDLTRPIISPQSPAENSNTISDLPSPISISSVHAPQPAIQPSPATPPARSHLQSSLAKTKTSDCLLLATYFDVALIRTLFSPSWLTDGYLWCLEYLLKRLVDISDKILSDALCAGMLPINLLRFKSLSIPQINIIQEQTFDKYFRETYTNEQVANDIIDHQSKLTIAPSPVKTAPILLNVPADCASSKGVFNHKYNTLHKKKRARQLLARSQIHYIDEEGIEHLDLAYTNYYDHFGIPTSSSKRNRLRLTDPSLFLFRTSVITIKEATLPPSTDALSSRRQTSTSAPATNLNEMKIFSASDSEINYRFLAEIKGAHSSSAYINRSGTINFGVVLAAVHAVVCKEHHLKACELVMSILDVLFGLNVISTTEDDVQKKQLFSHRSGTMEVIDEKESERVEEWLKQMEMKEDEKFQVAVDIILRILKRVGCSNCQSRGRSFNTDQLRGKIRVSLNKLRLLNQQRFEKCFLNFATNANLGHVFDVLHALCGYCIETTVGLAHYAPYLPSKSEPHTQHSYSNNFGNTHLSIGSKGIDGFILNIIFKPL